MSATFLSAYGGAFKKNPEAVRRVIAVWGDLSEYYAADSTAHPAIIDHLHGLLEGIAEGDEPTDAEIRTLEGVPAARHDAIDLTQFDPNRRDTYDGIFPTEGIAVLYGPPKSGKTLWLIDRLFTWHSTRNQSPSITALYIALEGGLEVVASVEGHKGVQREKAHPRPTRVTVVTPGRESLKLTDTDGVAAFARSMRPPSKYALPEGVGYAKEWTGLRQVESPDVVVVDTLSRAIPGVDENSTAAMTTAYAGLELLRERLGARLLIFVHHPAKDGDSPRGSGALFGNVNASVFLTSRGRGDTTVTTVKVMGCKGYEDKVSFRYGRKASEWTDLCKPGPTYSYLEFNELPTDATKAAPTTSASKAASALPDAPAKPVKADAPPTPPKAATGPKLNRTPLAAWNELALKPGDKLGLADARERILGGAVFAAVDSRRRAQKLADVLASFERAGLVAGDHLTYPPPAES